MAKSKNVIKVIMRSSDPDSSYFFTTTKNKKNNQNKLKKKSYDPVIRRHVDFNEEKIK